MTWELAPKFLIFNKLKIFQKSKDFLKDARWASFSFSETGLTLIEILVVLAIIASMMAFAMSTLSTSSGNEMRKTSARLFQTIKYVYHQAALTGNYYRIVFDLDEQQYHVEDSESEFFVVREGDEAEKIREENEENLDEDEKEASVAAATGQFAESEDDLFEIYQLPENIKISDVHVFHQLEKAETGKAYLYFFPRGYTEFAVIHLSDAEEEDFMSLIVNPLTADVEVTEEDVDYEEALEKAGGS